MTESEQLTVANLIIAITTYRQSQEPRRVTLKNLEEERAQHAEAVIEASDRLDSAIKRATVLTGKASSDNFALSIAYQVDDHLQAVTYDPPALWGNRSERAPYVSAWLHDLAFAVLAKATPEAIEAFDKKTDAAMGHHVSPPQPVPSAMKQWQEQRKAERALAQAPPSPNTTGYGW